MDFLQISLRAGENGDKPYHLCRKDYAIIFSSIIDPIRHNNLTG
jgi:hypothetical protein